MSREKGYIISKGHAVQLVTHNKSSTIANKFTDTSPGFFRVKTLGLLCISKGESPVQAINYK
jgi:hypothetical protein